MVARFLITTAEEATWRTDVPVLFLGEWCRLYARRHIWSKMDAEIVPYHWNDRGKLYKDYCNLGELYERILPEVADRLNEIHRVNHSLRYWRILIGPWLGYFIQMVFDRWEMIQNAVKHYEISGARVIEGDLLRLVPNDMDGFSRLFIGDQWNQAIYGYLLEHWTNVSCERIRSPSLASTTITVSNPRFNLTLPWRAAASLRLRFASGVATKCASRDCHSRERGNPENSILDSHFSPGRSASAEPGHGNDRIEKSSQENKNMPDHSIKRRLRRFIAGMVSKMLATWVRPDEAFFIADYLPRRASFALQWRLGQMPRMWRTIAPPSVAVNSESRRWRLSDTGDNDFVQALRALIPLQIPTAYLEGYGALNERISALPWPQHPWFIFTSNSYHSDDVFKAWAAEKVEAGAPLVIGQHGGGCTCLWSFSEEHEITIGDRYISWGWEDDDNNKIKPVGNLKMAGHRLGWDPEGYALMVEMTMPRYSYYMYSVPVASQWLGYFDDQSRFVDALPQDLRRQLLVRLYSHDYGWCQKQRWQDRFPQIRMDDGTVPIASLIEKSRLYISKYNGTTYMESLAMNIPTIIFWNPKHWELCASAQPYFDRLKKVGIFHETPESAAAKVAEVWNDVSGWWHQPAIQEARLYFCHRFSRMPENPLAVLKDALTTVKPGGLN